MEKKDILLIIIIFALVAFSAFLILRNGEEENDLDIDREEEEIVEEEEEEEEKEDFEEKLKANLDSFIGLPQKDGPLDEETLYTQEGFDSTTLVLSLQAKTHLEEDPAKAMEKINYYPPGEVSYENRLHFSSYRNFISPYFEDITREVGGDVVERKTVFLNKEGEDGRLIDIDWEEEIDLYYIPLEYASFFLTDLPSISGAMFLLDGDEEIGLDVRTEGIVLEREEFVYASRSEGEVIKVDFRDYLEEADFDGVIFYRFLEVN